MKTLLKSVLTSVLGEDAAQDLLRRFRGQPLVFSEADLIARWFRAHPRAGVMVDVGAHFGESFAPYLARGWQVLAFEPDPANRARLLQNVAADRIRLFECAVSDHEEEGVPFFASPESDGISGLSAFRETHKEVNRVRLTTLDKILAEQGGGQVDFLKIDTEGHDFFVLKGFPWSRIKPDVVLCEFEDAKTRPLGYDYRQMGDFLVAQGYQVFLSEWAPITRYGVQHQWRRWSPYPCDLQDAAGWGNFVAFRAGLPLGAADEYRRRFAGA
jgi:FkbM family methyltransferase